MGAKPVDRENRKSITSKVKQIISLSFLPIYFFITLLTSFGCLWDSEESGTAYSSKRITLKSINLSELSSSLWTERFITILICHGVGNLHSVSRFPNIWISEALTFNSTFSNHLFLSFFVSENLLSKCGEYYFEVTHAAVSTRYYAR